MFLEETFKKKTFIGVDEVGRGPLAGPVVACAFYYHGGPKNFLKDMESLKALGVTDSKKLTHKKRMAILNELGLNHLNCNKVLPVTGLLKGKGRAYLVQCCVKTIDDINILQASLKAMSEAIKKHDSWKRSLVLIDGNKLPQDVTGQAIVKGDSKCFSIAVASIIAKVFRDELMVNFDKIYPHYNFAKNSGYPTKAHKDALIKYGVTEIHRKTFKGVRELL